MGWPSKAGIASGTTSGKIPTPTQYQEKDEYEVYGEVKSNSVESWTLAQIYAAVKDQKPNLL